MSDARIHDILEEVAATAVDYGITDADITALRSNLDAQPFSYQAGYRTSRIEFAIVDAAQAHRAECVGGACRTCDALRPGIAMCLTGLRMYVDHDLQTMVDADRPAPSWWKRWLSRLLTPLAEEVFRRQHDQRRLNHGGELKGSAD